MEMFPLHELPSKHPRIHLIYCTRSKNPRWLLPNFNILNPIDEYCFYVHSNSIVCATSRRKYRIALRNSRVRLRFRNDAMKTMTDTLLCKHAHKLCNSMTIPCVAQNNGTWANVCTAHKSQHWVLLNSWVFYSTVKANQFICIHSHCAISVQTRLKEYWRHKWPSCYDCWSTFDPWLNNLFSIWF